MRRLALVVAGVCLMALATGCCCGGGGCGACRPSCCSAYAPNYAPMAAAPSCPSCGTY